MEVFLLSDLAAELAGGGEHPGKADSGQDHAAWMRDHVEEGVVAVTAVLGAAELSMGEILSLESGDVFVLPIQAGAGSVLRVQGKSIAAGTPVQSEGKYALCITSVLDESTSTAPAEATERNDANG